MKSVKMHTFLSSRRHWIPKRETKKERQRERQRETERKTERYKYRKTERQ
jgi:hypothetical protein